MRILVRIIGTVLLVVGTTSSQIHPRLFFGQSDVDSLKSRATTPGTPAYQIWQQVMKEKQADWFKDPTRQIGITNDPWQMESLLSVALGYLFTTPPDSSYLDAVRDIVFGGPHVDTSDALINRIPFESLNYFDVERYRTAQVTTLSVIADVLWNWFTPDQRIRIGQKVVLEINNQLSVRRQRVPDRFGFELIDDLNG